jgi:hypothetical protein
LLTTIQAHHSASLYPSSLRKGSLAEKLYTGFGSLDVSCLLKCLLQNVDALERLAGIPEEVIVEAHGSFFTSHCIEPSCKRSYNYNDVKGALYSVHVFLLMSGQIQSLLGVSLDVMRVVHL